jgi:type I restriction enzyme, R subunit
VYHPFHLYSMRQAIEEEFILDVLRNYTTYSTFYKVAKVLHDDPQVAKAQAASAIAKYVSLHKSNIDQRVQIMVEHFRQATAAKIGGRAKAMIVTRSRLHAVKYKQAIDRFIEAQGYSDLRVLVAFSGTVTDELGHDHTEAQMNGFGEKELPARFAGDDYRILVVAEKYQTGYDQPLLHTMYVDKKLEGVRAVQTLSRLNRIHSAKDETFVLDFANDGETSGTGSSRSTSRRRLRLLTRTCSSTPRTCSVRQM